MPSSSWSIRVPDWWEVDAVGVVLDLRPACTDAHRRPSARDQVDGRHCLGQDGRMAVADRVHEGSALHPIGLAGEGGMHGDGFQTGGVGWVAGGAVEVVPDRDPVEAEGLDPLPQQAQLVRGGVLQAGVYTEATHRGTAFLGSERPSTSEGAASGGLRGRGTQLRRHLVGT